MENKVDSTVKKESLYIAVSVILLSMLMEAVFLIAGKWTLGVLWGNLLGGGVAILNFFLMGLTVQKAVGKDQKEATALMKFSQTYRFILQLAAAAVGVLVPVFNWIAVLVPLFFPRIAIALRPFVGIKYDEAAPEAKQVHEEEVKETDELQET